MCAPRDCVCRGKTLHSSQRSSCRRPHCTSCTSPESDAAWLPARRGRSRWCSNDASRNFNECSYIQRMSSSLLALLMITHDAPTSMSSDVSSDAKPEQQIVRIPTMEPRPKGPLEERRNAHEWTLQTLPRRQNERDARRPRAHAPAQAKQSPRTTTTEKHTGEYWDASSIRRIPTRAWARPQANHSSRIARQERKQSKTHQLWQLAAGRTEKHTV